jgi:signal transduction histidine kinase
MEEQVSSHLNDLEGLNSELEGFLADLHGREETLSSRVKGLEEELSAVRASAAAELNLLAQKEASLAAALEGVRSTLARESTQAVALSSERDELQRKLDVATRQLEDTRVSLSGKLEVLTERFEDAKSAVLEKEALLKETRTAAREKAAELSGELDKARVSLQDAADKISALVSERDGLLGRLRETADMLKEEKAASAQKDILLKEARASVKEKISEFNAALDQAHASVRAETERCGELVRERDGLLRQLEADKRLRDGLEKKLDLAAQESSRSEEGFQLKVELVKKEMREQAKRAEDLERKLTAAGARLEDALDEAAGKEKLLAEASAALADKEAQLKDANLKLKELTKEFAEIKSGSLQENVTRARETAAAMAARVEELENSLSESAARHMDKFRAVQAELSSSKAELRAKEEENAALLAREDTISKELGDAEEKWKFATAQLNNSASNLRNAENEMEIMQGRMRSLEEERNKFRAAAIKAETSASGLVAQEARARDSEASGLMAALEEQAGKYTDLLRKYDDIVLLNESLAREKAAARTDAESLRDAFKAAQASADAEAGEKRGERSSLSERVRILEAQLKKKEYELEESRSAADIAAREAEELRQRLDEEAVSAEGEVEGERERYAALLEKTHKADALLKIQEFELTEARAAADSSAREAFELRARLEEKEDTAAGEAEAERERYAALSEKMHNAEALLKKKEFELEEAKGSLSILDGECSMLRDSRAALGEKYAREIQAENELLRQAQGRITDRDSVIARLTGTEEELKKEAEALRKEKQSLLSLVRKKSSGAAHSAKVSEAERMLAEKESRLVKLRADLENTRAEKAELQGREKELREELKSRPYRAMLREAEEKLLIKEKMLSDMTSRMQRIGKDFEELKVRGQSAGAPGYLPDFEELVAGVAHQVANSISIIRSHAEFCTEAPDSEGARESLDVIVRNIVNLQKKIDIIMNFSRPVIPQRSPERLGAVLSEVLDSLRASGRLDNVKIKVKGGDRLKPVNLDRVRFEAALEQLLINAAEAMPAGGELSASVAGGPGKQRLEISDTGPGIEKKNLGSVFHPFFTTKPGKMGLGLTLARNVVRAHGGTLELHSEAGKGTRVVMELPEIS